MPVDVADVDVVDWWNSVGRGRFLRWPLGVFICENGKGKMQSERFQV